MTIMGPTPARRALQAAQNTAAARHNVELRKHTGSAWSTGEGLLIACLCGNRYNGEAWMRHLFEVCRDTPVRV